MTQAVTDVSFENDVLNAELPTLVDFWAEWCGPCRMIAPAIEEIAQEYAGRLNVVKLNVDENRETPSRFGIMGIPTLILFKGGQEVERLVGFRPKDGLAKAIEPHLT